VAGCEVEHPSVITAREGCTSGIASAPCVQPSERDEASRRVTLVRL